MQLNLNFGLSFALSPFFAAVPEPPLRAVRLRRAADFNPVGRGEGEGLQRAPPGVPRGRHPVRPAEPVRVGLREHRAHGLPAADGAARHR